MQPRIRFLRPHALLWVHVISANDDPAHSQSIPTVQPVIGRPMWASQPGAAALNSLLFVSQLSIDSGVIAERDLKKKVVAVKGCSTLGKKDFKLNTAQPVISVDPETYEVSGR